jgi:hypothetical protein
MIAMDNCEGKNKNIVVLHLAPYLVEMGYFCKVEFTFYICGHTKNVCDRTHHQMKSKYHRKDVFTWEQVLQTINIKEHINVMEMKEDFFKDYGEMLYMLYGTFKPGAIKNPHLLSGIHRCITGNAMFYSFEGAIHRASDFEKRAGEGRQDKNYRDGSIQVSVTESSRPSSDQAS